MAGMRFASCLAMDGQVQTMVHLPPSPEALVPVEKVQFKSLAEAPTKYEALEAKKARRRRENFGIWRCYGEYFTLKNYHVRSQIPKKFPPAAGLNLLIPSDCRISSPYSLNPQTTPPMIHRDLS